MYNNYPLIRPEGVYWCVRHITEDDLFLKTMDTDQGRCLEMFIRQYGQWYIGCGIVGMEALKVFDKCEYLELVQVEIKEVL